MITNIIFSLLAFTILNPVNAFAANPVRHDPATLKDMRATLGSTPKFMLMLPPEALPGAWQEMKTLQVSSDTALSGKTKELIGLGVSAQVPCKYCVYFHTETAKVHGTSDREVREALVVASLARKWATFIEGTQIPMADFRRDADRIMRLRREKNLELANTAKSETQAATGRKVQTETAGEADLKRQTQPGAMTELVSVDDALEDIENTFGIVPEFIRRYPSTGLVGAWRELKNIMLNPDTALTSKQKDLISLAVSAQIPCQYCIYFDTESAKVNGATEQEINETLAMASATRHWSTFLNGMQINEAAFRKETQQILRHLREQSKVNVSKR